MDQPPPGARIETAIEEAAFRGVLFAALHATLRARAAAVFLQAVPFAALHLHGGFPRGASGVALTFIYGLGLGALRVKAGGLLAPWIAHVLTNLVIAGIVFALVRC